MAEIIMLIELYQVVKGLIHHIFKSRMIQVNLFMSQNHHWNLLIKVALIKVQLNNKDFCKYINYLLLVLIYRFTIIFITIKIYKIFSINIYWMNLKKKNIKILSKQFFLFKVLISNLYYYLLLLTWYRMLSDSISFFYKEWWTSFYKGVNILSSWCYICRFSIF